MLVHRSAKPLRAHGIARRKSVSAVMSLLIEDIATSAQILGKKPPSLLTVVGNACRSLGILILGPRAGGPVHAGVNATVGARRSCIWVWK